MADSAIIPAAEVRSFRQLLVWERAIQLAVDVHRAAALLPPHEMFALGKDLRRSSVSIPSNIAEGFNRHSRAAYRSHVGIALGSDGELMSCAEAGRLLQGLWRSLK